MYFRNAMQTLERLQFGSAERRAGSVRSAYVPRCASLASIVAKLDYYPLFFVPAPAAVSLSCKSIINWSFSNAEALVNRLPRIDIAAFCAIKTAKALRMSIKMLNGKLGARSV